MEPYFEFYKVISIYAMKIFVILFFVMVISVFPQEKYLISFKDKGISPEFTLSKNSQFYDSAIKSISEKSIARRLNSSLGENIVNYDDIPVKEEYVSELESYGVKIIHRSKWFNAVSANLTGNQISLLKKLNFIDSIEPVRKFVYRNKFNLDESQQSFEKNKNTNNLDYGLSFTQLDLSNIPEIHSRGITGKNIVVGLLDTGFDWQQHESLSGANVLAEYDFVFNDGITRNEAADASSQHDHGTYVFSIVGGNSSGKLIGAAYESSFLLAKTEYVPTETHTEEDNYARALEWMDSIGVDITSSSLGYNEFDSGEGSYSYSQMDGKTTIVTKAAEKAFERGIVVITSAGNEGNSSWRHITAPADGFNTIAVGAINAQNQLASFSSRGPTSDNRVKPEIVTQGVAVYGATASTVSNYGYANGTSSAAPIAAGISALLMSAFPQVLDNVQVRNILIETADQPSTPDNNKGYGLSSALRAITFPVLFYYNNHVTMMKRFQQKNINPTSVKLNFKKANSELYSIVSMNDSASIFSADISGISNGEVVNFFFSYKDSVGLDFREPGMNKDYNFIYGSTKLSAQISYTPTSFKFEQNYPNPFKKNTAIVFYSPRVENVELIIYNVIGEQIKIMYNGASIVGKNEFVWNGKNAKGIDVASGVYYSVLRVGNDFYAKKMLLLR
ncbi:MAG TPA: S8 family serine peptidase [Ignavibacteriaceae bacterium]|nr:S8 family serine peptidase [Ignavibacteriaceae bacterium]